MEIDTIYDAKDFHSRSDLERVVMMDVGLTPEPKRGFKIIGKRNELKLLQLSDGSSFWGIPVEITDTPTQKKPPKVKRTVKPSGLNGRLKTNKKK